VLQRAIARAGIVGDFAAHSLRAGFITAAAAAGVAEVDIARISGHRSADVLRGYVRHATVLDAPPLAAIFNKSM
jgi:integrase